MVECALCKREAPGSKPGFSTSSWSYSVMVITLDFESSDPGSNPGRTSIFFVNLVGTGGTSQAKKEWRIRVSIPVPHACKARTLPIELIPRMVILIFDIGISPVKKG